ncbi:MAG TPA: DUF411 domain-containing protein [Burkholderiales bacterium]|jgi:hypothetical protein|nr:DUF411 domain-containing protein [Burkholderiales bacterium]
MRPAFKLFAAAFLLLVTQIALAGPLITVYKNPTCGCCEKWAQYLQKEGFEVKAVNRDDLAAIKKQAGVQPAMSACHTALVDGYVIEGHVPAQAIRKLLQERPDTRGLSVPGMPANSPGMGEMDGKLKTLTLEGKLYSTD